jgi:sulfane dehydrogenase subunit SoxC
VLSEPYEGFQNAVAYRMRLDEDDPGEPLSRMVPRALMVPPGVPHFMSRRRLVEAGRVIVEGRAWSGWAPVESVEFGVDGEWAAAELEPVAGDHAWRRWTFTWEAAPGEHSLSCRARDASGREQPDEPRWNVGGYANNAVQQVPVVVT